MKAMMLREVTSLTNNPAPLLLQNLPEPIIDRDEILIRVTACGVCHTELDEIEGRTPPPHFPVVLGHQVIGVVEEMDNGRRRVKNSAGKNIIQVGQRVGVAWIY